MIVMMGNSAMNRGIGNIAMRRYTVSGVIRLLARRVFFFLFQAVC